MKDRVKQIVAKLRKIPLLGTILGMGWNLTFAIINAVLSIAYTSYWHLTLFSFYLLLGLMKMYTVSQTRSKKRKESTMLFWNGIAMFLIAVILCGLMILTIRERRNPSQDKIIMIVTAAYTFTYLGMTIRGAVRAFRNKSSVALSLRNISCASITAAFLSLERSMLGTFGQTGASNFNVVMQGWCGAVGFVFMLAQGVDFLVLSYFRRDRAAQ